LFTRPFMGVRGHCDENRGRPRPEGASRLTNDVLRSALGRRFLGSDFIPRHAGKH